MKNVVVISAHPDDETLGLGGTLLKLKKNKFNLFWIIITCIKENQGYSAKQIDSREKEILMVSKRFDFTKVFKLDYMTASLTPKDVNSMIPKISKIFKSIEPNIVYVLNRSDVHTDHRYTFDAVFSCTKSFRFPSIKKVLMYECISETEFSPAISNMRFVPNHFENIEEFIDQKVDIMKIYKSEINKHPFPRSEENLLSISKFRGAMSGYKFAEAFQLIFSKED